MAYGARNRDTAESGFRWLHPAGLLISLDTGSGLNHGDGPGWTTRLGDMPRSTMVDGSTPADIGDGPRVRSMRDPFMRQPWSHGLADLAGASTLASALVADWAGARWDGESLSIPGTTADITTSVG